MSVTQCTYCFSPSEDVRRIQIFRKGYGQHYRACPECRQYLRGLWKYVKP